MGFFEDAFTEASDTTLASHTPDVGTGYTLAWQDGSNPTFTVIAASDTLKGVSANNSGAIYTADATYPSADYEVEFTYIDAAGFDTRPFYVGVRLADIDNMYGVRISGLTTGTNAQLYKKVAGTWEALGTAVLIAKGSVVKVQIIGSALKLFDDTVEVDSVTDGDLTAAGKAWLGSGGGAELVESTDDANSVSEIDEFSVTDLGGGGGGDPEGPMVGGKLVGGGLLIKGRLVG